MKKSEDFIDVKETSLEEWLELLKGKNQNFIDCCFPTDVHEEKYLSGIHDRSDVEIYWLLNKFLFTSGSFLLDKFRLQGVMNFVMQQKNPQDWLLNKPNYGRLLWHFFKDKNCLPWEGITWILHLLPEKPKKAIDSIENYLIVHFQSLPDGRISGLLDAMKIIRAKFIGNPVTNKEKIKFLFDLDDRKFEILVSIVYSKMGYKTLLTKKTRDGGKDIIAEKNVVGESEKVAIECKLQKNRVTVEIVRSLRGVVNQEHFNRGIIVSASGFTKPARDLAGLNRVIELISGEDLVVLLNENLGANWATSIDEFIIREENKNSQSDIQST